MGCAGSAESASTDAEIAAAVEGATLYWPFESFSEQFQSVAEGTAEGYNTGKWSARTSIAFMKDPDDPATYKEVPHVICVDAEDVRKLQAKAEKAGASALAVLKVRSNQDVNFDTEVLLDCRLTDVVPLSSS